MYQGFDADAVSRLLGIGPDDRPHGLIVHGTYNFPTKIRRWRDRLTDARVASNAFNVVIGQVDGVTLWYTPVLGPSMAAYALHSACVLGAKAVVQIGSFGATRRGMSVGDLLLVTGAGRGDGVSDWYLPEGELASAHDGLTQHLQAHLAQRKATWHEGPVFTTPAFMAETWEDILRWEAEGYAGVEMEAATTFAIAQHFGVPAACLIHLLDNVIEERHILDNTEDERERIVDSRRLVEDIAIEALVTWGQG